MVTKPTQMSQNDRLILTTTVTLDVTLLVLCSIFKIVTKKAKTEKTRGTNSLLQHSTPTVELQMPFFPTHIEQMKLRKFHRPPFNTNEIPTGIQIQINSCSKVGFQIHAFS